MKRKYKLIIMMVVLSLLLLGCERETGEQNSIQLNSAPLKTTEKQIVTPEPTLTPSKEIKPSAENDDCYSNTVYIKQMDGYIQYVNEDFGFTMDFPQYWENNFIVKKSSDRVMWRVSFIGKSVIVVGKEYPRNAILMFWIISQQEIDKGGLTLDGTVKIGEINGENFYYATSTDYSIGAFENEDGMYDMYSDEEKEGIKADDELIKKMAADRIEAAKTLKEIEP